MLYRRIVVLSRRTRRGQDPRRICEHVERVPVLGGIRRVLPRPMFERAVTRAALLMLLASCSAHWNDPAPPSADYPCGPSGVVCSHKMCCTIGETCGGDDPTCPVSMCCDNGTVDPTDPNQDFSARRRLPPHPQRPQQ